MGVCSQPPAQEPFRPNCFRSARQKTKKKQKKEEKKKEGISSYLSRRQSSQQALQPKRSPVQLMVTACGFFFILFFLNTQTQELCESRMESVDESVPFKAKARTIDDNGVWLFFFFFFLSFFLTHRRSNFCDSGTESVNVFVPFKRNSI